MQGLLQHPDFYKVGVAPCLHDSRLTGATMWGDKYERSVETQLSPSTKNRFPEEYAEKLQGKLLLTGGMLDAGATPPATAFRLIEALQKANKDFDMILLPHLGHAPSPYLIRRAWDYLVLHLLGVEPPKEFTLSGVFGAPDPDALNSADAAVD